MERTIISKRASIYFLLIILLLQLPTVTAQNVQGFSWGVSEGARFDFHYEQSIPEYDYESATVVYDETQFDYYYIINNLPEIPDDITQTYYEWQEGDLSCYFNNGTQIEPFQFPNIFRYPYPVGNWTYRTELIMSNNFSGYTYQVVEDLFTWGYDLDIDFSEIYDLSPTYHFESRISKVDGVSNAFLFIFTYPNYSVNMTTTIQITRISLPIVPILVGSLILTGIIIAAVIFNRYQKRKWIPVKQNSDEDIEELLSELRS